MHWNLLKTDLRKAFLGFCFLALSQIIIQIQIIAVLKSVFKSSSLFEIVQEKRVYFYFLNGNESALFLSAGGCIIYAHPGMYSKILLVPWVLNSTIHWVRTSYFSLRSAVIAYGTEDFWTTILLMFFIILVKALLLYEVFMKLVNGALEIFSNIWRKESMAVVLWKGNHTEDQQMDKSYGEPTHISDDEDF